MYIYIYIYIYQCFHSHYVQDFHKGVDHWEVTLIEKCEMQNNSKKG